MIFGRIRQYLIHEVAVLAADTLLRSCVDYCNFLLRGLSSFKRHKLQSIQDMLAHSITNDRKYAYATQINSITAAC